jgi:biopolymer transport protein ExbB/TolQ
MLIILGLFGAVSLLIILYVVWTFVVDVQKLYRIRRAIERGEQFRLYLRNNHRDMHEKLKYLEQLARIQGRPMTIITIHNDKDFPDLITGFNVKVG